MNPFEFCLAVIAIVMIGKVLKDRARFHHGERPSASDSVEAAQLRNEIRTLRDRIAVLERVITDNHSSLSLDREIERLRDENRV